MHYRTRKRIRQLHAAPTWTAHEKAEYQGLVEAIWDDFGYLSLADLNRFVAPWFMFKTYTAWILKLVGVVLIACIVIPADTVSPIHALFAAPVWVAALFWANALMFWGIVLWTWEG